MTGTRGKTVAMLVAHGFEQSELLRPKAALEAAGVTAHVVSPETNKVRGWNHTQWGEAIDVDVPLSQVRSRDYDGLILPGGQMNPDFLRGNDAAVEFVKEMYNAGKIVAAICHGPWLLVEAGLVRGRTVTSFGSIRTDLVNAGANWIDRAVVTDGNIITSRSPADLDAFSAEILELLAVGGVPVGVHTRAQAG